MVSTELDALLQAARTVAVVGCTPRPGRAANFVPRYLQAAGLRVVPINPHHEEILGETCYPDIAAVPREIEIDIVDVFRRPDFVPDVVRDVVRRVERTGERPLIFTQVGVHHPDAQRIAEEAGLPYVADRCLMVDYRTHA
jgi:predicted CoA-binding protein